MRLLAVAGYVTAGLIPLIFAFAVLVDPVCAFLAWSGFTSLSLVVASAPPDFFELLGPWATALVGTGFFMLTVATAMVVGGLP